MAAMKKGVFSMPAPVTIMGRTSSITNAFVNGIIPVIEPSEEEIDEALKTLGMTQETVCCAYCGDPHTEWDHFRPLVVKKCPTGYISEIHNLVPACSKCNQSKGNKEWRKWICSDAKLSPKTRRISDIEDRIKRLEAYEEKYVPIKLNFEMIVGKDLWALHWKNHKELHQVMKECQKTSNIIKEKITEYLKTTS